MFIKKPLLAADVEDVTKLDFSQGFLATPKIDGIRCIVTYQSEFGCVLSRTFKPIPNEFIVSTLSMFRNPNFDLDGELVSGSFQDTTSIVMRKSSSPVAFTYYVFDALGHKGGSYVSRLEALEATELTFPACICLLNLKRIYTLEAFCAYEKKCLKNGCEGVMLRRPLGIYKFGRSTLQEEILLKIKRWRDSEAVIEGFEPFYTNMNESVPNHLGYAKKAHTKAGKKSQARLGAFIVRDVETGKRFTVGSGLNDDQREKFWECRDELVGRIIKYKFVPHGVKDLPRHPIFVGFRDLNF